MQPIPQNHRVDDDHRDDVDPVVDRESTSHEAGGARADEGPAAAAVPDLAVLDGLTERSPHEHAPVYEQIHAQLQNALREIDDA